MLFFVGYARDNVYKLVISYILVAFSCILYFIVSQKTAIFIPQE